ncbi:MAG: hypothetical protein O7G85_04860 [Planctomycetota bacterium]|nr:hypothetical protein [Planctomycetota bacterium]
MKITPDELAEIIASHCHRDLGLQLPEGRKYMLSLTADGQPCKRLKLVLKW